MSGNQARSRTVYIGNLDERVTDRVLYDILIQAGRVVDLIIPKDRETDRPKGFAFAEYESEEIADYAIRLFSGLVTLYNRTLRFGFSGQDKSSSSTSTVRPTFNARSQPVPCNDMGLSPHSMRSPPPFNSSAQQANYAQAPLNQSSAYQSSRYQGSGYNNRGRVFGAALDTITRSR
ncbi:hypothetical protein DCAR_0831984 [Daucus carota subsp. sativus]|uniref:RRM domain-containing protein n=1 Tax=Daucus carota subsp. sativus TaxID=79200 RepID=A0AAF0XQM4_DAUCS|nr:PREDICTED: RNA-binding protein 7-like [Daucus carota subsp. sativus]WOH12480.1 hypothetical protein DCAR_0831984 [Daucus carota subsp. sativus]